MRSRSRTMVAVAALVTALAWAPELVEGNAARVQFLMLNDEGKLQHVVPRSTTGVRMVAERVVLVPFLDRRSQRAHVLVSARYDFKSRQSHQRFQVGYPELKGAFRHFANSNLLNSARNLKLRQPTIWRFSARVNGRPLTVREHPGVARYRRWFTFGLPLPARQRVRLRVRYVSRVGRSLRLFLSDRIGFRNPGLYTWADYWIDYVLHTGSTWAGTIGKGEVALFFEGRHYTLKRFKNLKPTRKDDLTVRLPLGRIALPKATKDDVHQDTLRVWERRGRVDVLDTLRLVHGSTTLGGVGIEGLGALAVDGDPASGWISAPQKAVGAWLQVPADAGRALKSIQLRSLTRGGVTRPARIEVRCLQRLRGVLRQTSLSTTAVRNTAGPHRLPTRGARGCAALRLRVLAVHGKSTLPVGISEVEQSYATPPKAAPRGVKLLPCCFPRTPPKLCRPPVRGLGGGGCTATGQLLRRAIRAARPAIAKIPTAHLKFGYEVARISDVRWSPDGTVVHYRLWLENEHHSANAVLMGHFVEVATGRVLGRYRLDQAGRLPEPQRSQWKRAMSFEAGARLLDHHKFVAARLQRSPPAVNRAVARLGLRGAVSSLSGRLRVKSRRTGFSWRFEPNMVTRAQKRTSGTLRLVKATAGTPAQPLISRRPDLEHGFSQRHRRTRDRRRKIVAKVIRGYKSKMKVGTTLARLFRRVHAFTGSVKLYWHPKGRAVLAAWQDFKELSGLLPDSVVKLDYESDAEYILPPRWWDRMDYARVRALASVHPLVSTPRTTLRFSPSVAKAPVGKRTPSQAQPTGSRTGRPVGPSAVAKPRTGCGCNSGPGLPGLPAALLLSVQLLLIWRGVRRTGAGERP